MVSDIKIKLSANSSLIAPSAMVTNSPGAVWVRPLLTNAEGSECKVITSPAGNHLVKPELTG